MRASRGTIEAAPIRVETVGTAIEGEGGFPTVDCKVLQFVGGNIRQVCADEIKVTLSREGINMIRQNIALQEINAAEHIEFPRIVLCDFERR